jgi:drug/metabolite transporter (DMT)-like permease
MNTQTQLKSTFLSWDWAMYQGAFWKLVSCAAFAGINAIVRYLTMGVPGEILPLPSQMLVFFQNLFGVLFILPFLFLSSREAFKLKTQYPKLHFLRIATAVLGVTLWYLSLKYINLAEAVALSFTGPVLSVLGACLFLGETLGGKRLLAIAVSMIGAFIIARPDIAFSQSEISLGVAALLPLGSALAFAVNKLLTRQLGSRGESAQRLTWYLLLGMAPVSFIPALLGWVTPSAEHWPWLLLLGALGFLANFAFGKAYALAEVTFLTPFGFSKFLFSMGLGYYCFSEIPSMSVWMGLSIIGLSIFLLVYKIPLYSMANRFKSN